MNPHKLIYSYGVLTKKLKPILKLSPNTELNKATGPNDSDSKNDLVD